MQVVSGIVAKCLGSPKAKIKDLAGQIVLMYIEIERQEQVLDELIKGGWQDTPHSNWPTLNAFLHFPPQAWTTRTRK